MLKFMAPGLARALCVATALCAATPVLADAAEGGKVAEKLCASCHELGAEPSAAKMEGPSFVAIGRMPSTTELSIKVFLQSSHRNMPNLLLSPEDIDSLAAYILELGGKGRS